MCLMGSPGPGKAGGECLRKKGIQTAPIRTEGKKKETKSLPCNRIQRRDEENMQEDKRVAIKTVFIS